MLREERPEKIAAVVARLCACLIALAYSLGPGHAAASSVLKFGYILSPTSQLGRGEQVFASEIAKRTDGRYEIENYPDAMLGGEVAMMKDVQLGALDIAFITGAPLPNVVPAAGVFNVPFLFADAGAARSVLDGSIGDEYLTKFEQAGMVGLAWGENGMRQLTNSKRPIRNPIDLKGMKIRLPQSDVMTAGFKALGADVEQIAFPQLYAALRSGSIDGQENPIATILSSRFYEVQAQLSLTSHVYDPAVILMSKDAFAGLSEADKSAFKAAARVAARESRLAATEAERDGIATLQAKGMTVTRDVDRSAFASDVAAASPTFDRMFGQETVARIKRAAAASSNETSQQHQRTSP